MFIKKVLTYDYNYAEYTITDGKYDLHCVCMSVPLPKDQKPISGMKVAKLEVFVMDDIKIKRIEKDDNKIYCIKKGKYPLEHIIKGRIIDRSKALIGIGEITVSLENNFETGLPICFSNGDFVEFKADRLDCTLE